MSFVLDALKKLEREKETRESGVLMVGAVQWGGPERPRRRRRLAVGAAALVILAAAALWWLSSRPVSAPAAPEVSVESAPAAARSTATPSATESRQPPARRDQKTAPRPGELDAAQTPPAATAPETWSLDLPGDGLESQPAPPAEATTILEDPPVQWEDPDPDPAIDDTPTSAPVPEFRLTAISERDGEPIALLNDRLVREGDSFEGLRILRIGDAEVEIEVHGERRTIGF